MHFVNKQIKAGLDAMHMEALENITYFICRCWKWGESLQKDIQRQQNVYHCIFVGVHIVAIHFLNCEMFLSVKINHSAIHFKYYIQYQLYFASHRTAL